MQHFTASDGARLVYRDEGEGLPVLALGGQTGPVAAVQPGPAQMVVIAATRRRATFIPGVEEIATEPGGGAGCFVGQPGKRQARGRTGGQR